MKNDDYLTMLTPGLVQSSEAYFGDKAPLAQTLISYSEKIKEFIGEDYNSFKDKKFQAELLRLTNEFGNAIAKDINAERCQIIIPFDPFDNAFAVNLSFRANTIIKSRSGNYALDLDNIVELEDIVITSEGYKYRTASGKILIISINSFVFQSYDARAVAAIIAHEIGHGFQQGIYGVYKGAADALLTYKIETIKSRYGLSDRVPGVDRAVSNSKFFKFMFKSNFIGRFLWLIISYFMFPEILTEGIFSKIGTFLYKAGFKNIMSENTYLLKERLEHDKRRREDKDINNSQLVGVLAGSGGMKGDKEKLADGYQKSVKEQYKRISTLKDSDLNDYKDMEFKQSRNMFKNFFKSIGTTVSAMDENFFNLITLSDYTINTYNKISFLKKYEYFADVFATSYGFSTDLYKFIKTSDDDVEKYLKSKEVGINKIPLFKLIYRANMHKIVRREFQTDPHGSAFQRMTTVYTALQDEIKTNPDLTTSQRKGIQEQMEMMLEMDKQYYEDKRTNDIYYRTFTTYANERLKGNDKDVEKYVLEPIKQICREEIKK